MRKGKSRGARLFREMKTLALNGFILYFTIVHSDGEVTE